MTELEFNQALQKGEVNFLPTEEAKTEELKPFSPDEYQAIISSLRRPRRHLTTHPTARFIPRNFLEQIQFIDNGTSQFLDIYINGHWYSFPGTLIV